MTLFAVTLNDAGVTPLFPIYDMHGVPYDNPGGTYDALGTPPLTDRTEVSYAGRVIGDVGATVSDGVVATRTRKPVDTGAVVSDSIAAARSGRFFTDTGASVTDSVVFRVTQPFRFVVDTGASVNDSLLSTYTVSRVAVDTYADGPAAVFGAATASPFRISLFGDVAPFYKPPAAELEVYYARLPLYESQKKFSETVPAPRTAVNTNCSWHGLLVDAERGAFALARAGGVLESMVGQRVKITKRGSSGNVYVVAYMHGVADIDPRDELTVSRRLFLALSVLGDDRVPVTVERLK